MKDIMIKIVGKQIASDNTEDSMEFITEGKYYQEEDSIFLEYVESEFSGMEGCVTSLQIQGEKILMERHGGSAELDTAIEFEKGRRFCGWYDTPFGSVEMEVLTNSVANNIEVSGPEGSLDIDYNISLKGLSEGRSVLKIEII